MNFIEKINILGKRVNKKIESIALFLTFFFGLSISAFLVKILHKNFLDKRKSTPTWKKYVNNENYNKMY